MLLKQTPYKNALVFCSRKQTVKQLTRELKQGGLNVEEIHSDLEQAQREDVLSKFTSGRIPVLVATDILSRGIDIDTIDVVINYDVPGDGEDYVHCIGRTAWQKQMAQPLHWSGKKSKTNLLLLKNY